jgi:hypothetical protein
MKRFLTVLALGLISAAGVIGCEASAKVDTNGSTDNGGSYSKTTVKRESPAGDSTYERRTETRTQVNP